MIAQMPAGVIICLLATLLIGFFIGKNFSTVQ